jgi:tRNA U34 5-carboxymethylaminomethyl modifying GTPase MnmE/TrmE
MLDKYNEVTGRTFENEEAAVEHLKNLQKLAFSKQEDAQKDALKQYEIELETKLKEKEEAVTKDLAPYKAWIENAGVDLQKVNPLAIKEYLGESHEDIKPRAEQVNNRAEVESLEQKIASGRATQNEREAYMRKTVLGPKK